MPQVSRLICAAADSAFCTHKVHSIAAGILLSALLPSCVLIDDFGKFKIKARTSDAAADDGGSAMRSDAGSDAGSTKDASGGCKNEDCSKLDSDCAHGECRDGACKAVPIKDGESCGGDRCMLCKNGECNAPKDCKSLDGDCAQGKCNPSTGACEASPANEGKTCFDKNPCSYDETCQAGTCSGKALNCSAYDDECSQGVCDPAAGGCTFGPNRMSQPCDDANPCTLNDKCSSAGRCESTEKAPVGTACDDFNPCTGTNAEPDACNSEGDCGVGGSKPEGTVCNDDNECTINDACDDSGLCFGDPTREGERCNTACSKNTVCLAGICKPLGGAVPDYDKRCFLQWCGFASLCEDRWSHDRLCDCGCPFSDPDCNDCSMRMCESDSTRNHRATVWCDQTGKAIGNCPDSLKGNGRCDCGCQFTDPDCSGGACCGPTGKGGCGNDFIQECVCGKDQSNSDKSCCNDKWTQRCADLAVALGCMLCP